MAALSTCAAHLNGWLEQHPTATPNALVYTSPAIRLTSRQELRATLRMHTPVHLEEPNIVAQRRQPSGVFVRTGNAQLHICHCPLWRLQFDEASSISSSSSIAAHLIEFEIRATKLRLLILSLKAINEDSDKIAAKQLEKPFCCLCSRYESLKELFN